MMCLRSIYETVAAFLDFEKKLQTLIVRGDLQAIFVFAKQRTHFTKVEHLVAEHGDQIKATNILTQVEKMARLRPNIMGNTISFPNTPTRTASAGYCISPT
jgi:hypothetical protein